MLPFFSALAREREGSALKRGRDSTDRCVPVRSPSVAGPKSDCLLQSQKNTKTPNRQLSALRPLYLKIKVSKTGRYKFY